jgi:hypothetical protein
MKYRKIIDNSIKCDGCCFLINHGCNHPDISLKFCHLRPYGIYTYIIKLSDKIKVL